MVIRNWRRGSWLAAVALVATGAASGQTTTFLETFDNGSNIGGWTYAFPDIEVIQPEEGNPGWWLHCTCSGFACMDAYSVEGRTSGGPSVFTGDYRARRVSQVGHDAINLRSNLPSGGRPMTVMLTNSLNESVYFVGTLTIPVPGAGWRSFTFPIPSQATTMPAGWHWFDDGTPPPALDPLWNRTITDVAKLSFLWGDPMGVFMFQRWEPGIDKRVDHVRAAVRGGLEPQRDGEQPGLLRLPDRVLCGERGLQRERGDQLAGLL